MPLPTPNNNESRDEFINRCMSDDNIQQDFDSQDQQLAVCNTQWEEKDMSEETEKNFQATFDIAKQDEEKQLVGGMILKADRPDADGDIFPEDVVEDFLHKFMIKSQQMGVDHEIETDEIALVEAWTAKSSFSWNGTEVQKGDALGVAKIFDDDLWKMAKEGQFNSFSIEGRAIKEKIEDEDNI